jgi:hypothetical protein
LHVTKIYPARPSTALESTSSEDKTAWSTEAAILGVEPPPPGPRPPPYSPPFAGGRRTSTAPLAANNPRTATRRSAVPGATAPTCARGRGRSPHRRRQHPRFVWLRLVAAAMGGRAGSVVLGGRIRVPPPLPPPPLGGAQEDTGKSDQIIYIKLHPAVYLLNLEIFSQFWKFRILISQTVFARPMEEHLSYSLQ